MQGEGETDPCRGRGRLIHAGGGERLIHAGGETDPCRGRGRLIHAGGGD